MLNAIIVDDESKATKILTWEIEKFCPEINIIDTFTNPTKAISGINYLKPDCVFLDIEMPEMDGFQLLRELEFRDFHLIISTAYDSYAIKAFKENAIDYLLKPIDSDDLKRAVQKILHLKKGQNLGSQLNRFLKSIPSHGPKKIQIPLAGRTIYVEQNDVVYCKSDGNYTEIYLKDGTKHVITMNLKEVDAELMKEVFFRTHNSYLVQLHHVKEYVRTDGHHLIMDTGQTIPVSRSKKQELLKALEQLL
ncbi:MAG TPA: DNA-binding response regulator [Flavobacteriaceae bacterium]|nr:DNA-binding response regulator [Flavobacteriaceae bacterium]MAY53345.1 DNA-binding response regulator [Flavobacteriaceae bacterium]HBR54059.1 DNA-binding response regulator [Flavobacteriaceae bacterium]|tara:strand:+ start:314 stop:1060 length:747 start_codon:yes stop_codon:yes gene_type:complete